MFKLNQPQPTIQMYKIRFLTWIIRCRYESQEDQSLLGEFPFDYDSEWLTGQIKSSVEFWLYKREARYTPTEERWKCKYCNYTEVCKVN